MLSPLWMGGGVLKSALGMVDFLLGKKLLVSQLKKLKGWVLVLSQCRRDLPLPPVAGLPAALGAMHGHGGLRVGGQVCEGSWSPFVVPRSCLSCAPAGRVASASPVLQVTATCACCERGDGGWQVRGHPYPSVGSGRRYEGAEPLSMPG